MAQTKRLPPPVWLLFGLNGRVGRSLYWLAYAFIVCIQSAVIAQYVGAEAASYYGLATTIGPVVLMVTLYVQLAVSVKRLHDCGYNGAFAAAVLLPLISVVFTIWAGIIPGTPGPNRFGPVANVQPG